MNVLMCRNCGGPFTPKRQGDEYCSKDKCRSKKSWERERERTGLAHLELRVCMNCGKEFKPRAHNQKNCSSDCGQEYYTRNCQKRKSKINSDRYRQRKKERIENEIAGRSFAQALAEKYGLSLEE